MNVATAHCDGNVSFVGSNDRHLQVNAETVATRKFRGTAHIEDHNPARRLSFYSSLTQALPH